MLESNFQDGLIDDILNRFEGSIVLKNDTGYIQGFPDLTILYKDRWAVLECKKSKKSPYRPNQEYYLDWLNGMSFAATIYPENREEVLDELQQSFASGRTARVSRRK